VRLVAALGALEAATEDRRHRVRLVRGERRIPVANVDADLGPPPTTGTRSRPVPRPPGAPCRQSRWTGSRPRWPVRRRLPHPFPSGRRPRSPPAAVVLRTWPCLPPRRARGTAFTNVNAIHKHE